MSAAGTEKLQFIEGTMNAKITEHAEAEHDPLPSETGPQGIFQHDNDPKHISKMTTALQRS